jgi:hypothetical protein
MTMAIARRKAMALRMIKREGSIRGSPWYQNPYSHYH